MISVKVNGEENQFEQPINVLDFLELIDVEMPEYVSVQINDEIIPRDEFASKMIQDGFSVEIMYFMGGGAL